MIDREEVLTRYDAGESINRIAVSLGVTWNSVKQVIDFRRNSIEPERCDGCGHTVLKPCLICEARSWKDSER